MSIIDAYKYVIFGTKMLFLGKYVFPIKIIAKKNAYMVCGSTLLKRCLQFLHQSYQGEKKNSVASTVETVYSTKILLNSKFNCFQQ